MRLKKWDIIFFDLDNTLYSHEEAFQEAIIFCYENVTVPLLKGAGIVPASSYEWFKVFKGNCDKFWTEYEEDKINKQIYQRKRYNKTMEAFQYPVADAIADEFHELYERIVHNYVTPFAGVHECFEKLKKQGKKIGIITNGKKEIQMNKVRKLGLLNVISEKNIIISDEVGEAKPNKHIFDVVTLKWNYNSKRALFIGDSWSQDIIGAIDAGWDAIFLNSRNETCSSNHRPSFVANSFGEVMKFLQL
jgi:5'-nucleotidase